MCCSLCLGLFFGGRGDFTEHLYLVFGVYLLLDTHKEVKAQRDTATEGRHPPESDHSTLKVVVGVQCCVGAGKRGREDVTERVIWSWAPSTSLIAIRTLPPKFIIFFQFSSVTLFCLTLCDSVDCSTPVLPVHRQLPEFTQTHVH